MLKNRLLEIRLKLGYRFQKDFAEYLGLSKKEYNLLENNKRDVTLEKAYEIAERLNMKIEDIWFK